MVAPVLKITAPKIISDLIKWEAEPGYCRESGLLKANATVTIGTPLGRIAAGADEGKLVVCNPAANDGSEVCVALALKDSAAVSDVVVPYLARMAMISDSGIEWPIVFTSVQKSKVISDLAAHGIVTRHGL